MSGSNDHHETTSDREKLRRLESEISSERDELGVLVAELDRRRHQIFDVKGQLKRHVVEIGLAGAALTAITIVAIWFAVQRARRRATLTSRASRFKTAVNRMVAHPELVATGPTIPRSLFTAIAAAALGSATRTVVSNVIESIIESRRNSTSPSAEPRRAPRSSARHRDENRRLSPDADRERAAGFSRGS